MENYNHSLRKLKSAMFGGCELELIMNSIESLDMGSRKLTLLDVGGGDGEFLGRIVNGLTVDLKSIDCIEPQSSLGIRFRQFHPTSNFHPVSFKNFYSERTFDVILSIHSAYYFGAADKYLHKFEKLLSLGGHIIFSVWSEGCFLRELSRFIERSPTMDSSSFSRKIANLNPNSLKIRRKETFEGPIAVDKLLDLSDEELLGVASVIARHGMRKGVRCSEIRNEIARLSINHERKNTVFTVQSMR